MELTIYGASDDLIEVEGELREEFSPRDSGELSYLAFSGGTLLSVQYTNDGLWRINRLNAGTATYSKTEASNPDGKEYSDRVMLEGDFAWVAFGDGVVRAKKVTK